MSVTILGEGKAPPEILAALREIDPNADLVHLGGKRWWFGIRGPNPAAVEKLGALKKEHQGRPVIDDPAERAFVEDMLGRELVMHEIMADGFNPIDLYVCDGSPGWDIVEDFRIRDFNWRNKTEKAIRAELAEHVSIEAGNARRNKAWNERAKDAMRDAYRFIFRGARSVTVDHNLE